MTTAGDRPEIARVRARRACAGAPSRPSGIPEGQPPSVTEGR